ncbi:succinylglutamate desuccinylase/aspartoacylase family protein [Tianweitania populi]|uniref:succinylglutamate desuccinylase/aspartoacylase domain-containing protein n=1 Tax=Tianweitania populi TaxID=1607949 RepID=UPI0024553CCA
MPALTAELGGHATLSKEGMEIAEEGLWRVLREYQIVSGARTMPAQQTRFMQVRGRGAFVYMMSNGMFEPAADLGATVQDGQLAGFIHAIDQP